MPVDGVSTDRNYTSLLDGTSKTTKTYNAVFSNGEDSDLTVNDFFDMMITQLTNQDFMNPVDDTQYLAQMAQFATMQEMMDLCQYSKQNYAMSMLGKEVSVSKNNIGGSSETITGIVEKIGIEDNEYKLYVNGKAYDYSRVTMVSEETKTAAATTDAAKSSTATTDAAKSSAATTDATKTDTVKTDETKTDNAQSDNSNSTKADG